MMTDCGKYRRQQNVTKSDRAGDGGFLGGGEALQRRGQGCPCEWRSERSGVRGLQKWGKGVPGRGNSNGKGLRQHCAWYSKTMQVIVKLKASEGRMAGDKPGRMGRGPPHRACGVVRNWEFIPQRKEVFQKVINWGVM